MGSGGNQEVDSNINIPQIALYTTTGRECCFADSGVFEFRLRQLQMINHSIKILSSESFTSAESALVYKDARGHPSDLHSWEMLTTDPTFISRETAQNIFETFKDYISSGDKTYQKQKYTEFLDKFINIRNSLMDQLSQDCIVK